MQDRIVVTGTGTINSIGNNTEQTWKNAINGHSGVAPISLFDATHLLVQIACEVKDFKPELHLDPREIRRRDRFEQFAAIAVQEALSHSGIDINKENTERIGVVISSAIGGLNTVHDLAMTI